MGWGSGAQLMSEIIHGLLQQSMDDPNREAVYRVLIPAFQDMDWDTESDVIGQDPAFDRVLEDIYPEWFEESDE